MSKPTPAPFYPNFKPYKFRPPFQPRPYYGQSFNYENFNRFSPGYFPKPQTPFKRYNYFQRPYPRYQSLNINPQFNQPKFPRLFCDFCKKPGHLRQQCRNEKKNLKIRIGNNY